jgi:hypothetical protein
MTEGRTVAGVSDVTGIDASEVDRIGDAVLDAAGRLERIAGGMSDWQYTARYAVDGAEMCYSATPYAAGAWQATLGELAESVRKFGSGLRQAAADYRRSDSGVAAVVRGAGYGAAQLGATRLTGGGSGDGGSEAAGQGDGGSGAAGQGDGGSGPGYDGLPAAGPGGDRHGEAGRGEGGF